MVHQLQLPVLSLAGLLHHDVESTSASIDQGCFIRLSRDAVQALEKYPDIIFIQANYFVLSTLETGNEIVQLK